VEPKGQAIERYLRSGDYEHDHPVAWAEHLEKAKRGTTISFVRW
jgi:hypothetical protein